MCSGHDILPQQVTNTLPNPSKGDTPVVSDAGLSFHSGRKATKLVYYFVTSYIAMSFFAYPPSPPSFSGLGVGNAPRLLALHKPWSGWAAANIKHQTSLSPALHTPWRDLYEIQEGR